VTRRLRLPAAVVRELRAELLREDGQERFAFVDAGTDDGSLLAGRVDPVPDEDLARQSRTACRPSPAVEREHVSDCYDRGLSPVLVHSHPFAENPRFSGIDVESMGRFREWLTGLFPDRTFGFAVVGETGVEAVVRDGDRLASLPIEVVGEWKLDAPVPGSTDRFAPGTGHDASRAAGDASGTTDDVGAGGGERTLPADGREGERIDDRFDRNVRAFGAEGQRRLQSATVGVVGVGGLGSMVAEQLARLGVDELVLVDPDVVEESNLARLVGAYDHHVGKPKVAAVREHCWRSAPTDLTVETVADRIEARPEVLDDCDLVVGCVDEVRARSFCNEYAVKHLTYYVDAGVRIDTEDGRLESMAAYVQTVAPGATACFDCLGRHDREATRLERQSAEERARGVERGYVDEDDLEPEPAVVHLNGLCASTAVSAVVDIATGAKRPPEFVRHDSIDHEMTALATEPSAACPTCGDDGVLGVGRRSFGDARFTPESADGQSEETPSD